MVNDRHSGFTLIEILVALIIAGMGIAVLMDLSSAGLRLSGNSARISRETALARAMLAHQGTDLALAPGAFEGSLPDGYRWRSEIRAADPDGENEIVHPALVSITVWDAAARDPGVRLTTVRLLPVHDSIAGSVP